MRYKIELAYKGTNFHGWQRQPNATSVQEVLENAFKLIFKDNIELTGCGRTDTGVHAKYYLAHFDSNLKYSKDQVYKLNSFLNNDIVIFNIEETSDDFHARFDAVWREYEYLICIRKDPFLNEFSWQIKFMPDIEKITLAANQLLNYNDFTSFSKLHTDVKTNNCKILKAEFTLDRHIIKFNIRADRFLRNMVRAIVGTLIDVGSGKITVEDFCRIIESRDRSQAGQSAPAQGLHLIYVCYSKDV
ncbi:MAG: tRNA pseudouridine(38-40) synthase TruA [Bacteroidales bacterium]|jgi:tRNA pseudouridine38-40 synthase|nr:tRNA pseudouridine(38-40) synthase TruA [Bacteroidales bacterium]HOL97876.1 tRNA pseudouridine(38-40) synthase TruA [Bacteroidales bacterium]HOM35621.1 tRNA pseudouridine(38-40) synthase TruA [Bacteroidales bacterium]HPD22818.1 tRNA pseudouridine(38-40) synthase TruA [Bacteroidales bacterium]HRS98919.1 tRNA pseudouridine(38-40) synthase TruA [Bacteroidales bacterium]